MDPSSSSSDSEVCDHYCHMMDMHDFITKRNKRIAFIKEELKLRERSIKDIEFTLTKYNEAIDKRSALPRSKTKEDIDEHNLLTSYLEDLKQDLEDMLHYFDEDFELMLKKA